MFFHEAFDCRESMMVHNDAEFACRPFHHDMFVDFVVSTVGIISRDLFVSSQTMFEQAQFSDCQYHNLTGGIVAIHKGYKY